jgi:hypothetical protein
MAGEIFYNKYLLKKGATDTRFLLADGDYPASASYIDVSKTERFHVLVIVGEVHASDTVTFTLKCTTSASGTLTTVSATYAAVSFTGGNDSHDALMTVETKKLPEGYQYVSCVVDGATNGTYGTVRFFLPEHDQPVTQTSATILSHVEYVG